VQDVAHPPEVLLPIVVRDLEHRLLGALDDVARRCLVAMDARLDLVRRVEQAAEERVLPDDRSVAAQVADGRDRGGQRVDLGRAAGVLELAPRT
jgi:hypothetical protein